MDKPSANQVQSPRIAAPTSVELSIIYLLLGLHVAMGTDAVVPFFWLVILGVSYFAFLFWLILRVTFLLLYLCSRRDGIQWGRWLQVVAVIVIFLVIHLTPWGFMLRVWASERYVLQDVRDIQQALADGRYANASQSPGFGNTNTQNCLFTETKLRHVLDDGKTILWQTARGDSFFQPPYVWDGGLMYCETGVPPQDWTEFYVDHLYGPWWRWRMGD